MSVPELVCWFCTAHFTLDEVDLCSHGLPTPICPYCLNCFCTAPDHQRDTVRGLLGEMANESDTHLNLYSKPIGTILLESKLINESQLQRALEIQKTTGTPLGELVVDMGLVTAEQMRITLLNQQWIERVDLDNTQINLRLIERFGLEFCTRHQILPIELLHLKEHLTLKLAISNREALGIIRNHPAFQIFGILPVLADSEQIKRILNHIAARK